MARRVCRIPDVDAIEATATRADAEVEALIRVTIGEYVVYGQLIAEVTAHGQADAVLRASPLKDAIHRATKRDLAPDPLDGIEELETIGWTGISTAQSDPEAGVLTIFSLRDILARWCVAPDDAAPVKDPLHNSGGVVVRGSGWAARRLFAANSMAIGKKNNAADRPSPRYHRPQGVMQRVLKVAPVVYEDDVMAKLLNAFESLAVSASESMQHQSLAEILRTFTLLFDVLPQPWQLRAEDIILRTLSAMGDHVLTGELETALNALVSTLDAAHRPTTAAAVRAAQSQLASSIGKLGNRATRMGKSAQL